MIKYFLHWRPWQNKTEDEDLIKREAEKIYQDKFDEHTVSKMTDEKMRAGPTLENGRK